MTAPKTARRAFLLSRFTTILFAASSLTAHAAEIVVNSTADPAGFNPAITIAELGATVTLRDAVNAANNTPGNDQIVFAPGLVGQTITLSRNHAEEIENWRSTVGLGTLLV